MQDESKERFGDRIQRRGFLFLATIAAGALLSLAGFALFGKRQINGVEFVAWLVLELPVSYGMASLVWIAIEGLGNGLIRLLTSSSGTPPAYQFSEQEALVVQWKYAEAIDSYRKYIDEHPGEVEARVRLGLLFADQRDFAAADAHLRETRILGGSPQQQATVDNALIDICAATGNEDALRAELSRFSRTYAGSAAAAAAKARLRAMVVPAPQ